MYTVDDPKFIALVEKGVPVSTLEKMMRPVSVKLNEITVDERSAFWNSDYRREIKEHEWDDFSPEGFLGRDENLLDVILDDWKMVESYGTTHQNIAIALKRLMLGEHEVHPDFVYLGGEDYQKFWFALGLLGDIDSTNDFVFNDRWSMDNGGPQGCSWLCYAREFSDNDEPSSVTT